MSLPYFPMYPTDFEADTSHLSMAEDGAYNRLLRICWMTPGCTMPTDEAWIMRRVRAQSDEDREAVKIVLSEEVLRSRQRIYFGYKSIAVLQYRCRLHHKHLGLLSTYRREA